MAKKIGFPNRACPKCGKPIHIRAKEHDCGWKADAHAETPSAIIRKVVTAKTGKAARQATGSRRSGARRGSRREALLELIRQSDGLSRGEILERMGLKGDCPASTPVRQRRPVEEERVNGSSSPVKERRWDNNPSG